METNEPKTNKTLADCFKTIIDGQPLDLKLDELYFILRKMGKVLNGKLREIVPYMMVHYMQNWPGWQKMNSYRAGKLSYNDYLKTFEEYVVYKVNYLIQHDYVQALRIGDDPKVCEKPVVKQDTMGVNTAPEKVTAPFQLMVDGNPGLSNSMVFCKSKTDIEHIFLKTHGVTQWQNLTFRELLNWTNIEVRLYNRDISFVRKTQHSYKRYLALMKDVINVEKPATVVESAEIIDETKPRKCVPLKVLKEYFNILMGKMNDTPLRTEHTRIKELIQEILLDVMEINFKDSFATNTRVSFKIGGTNYARNKKLKQEDTCFSELLTPKVELTFIHFMPYKMFVTESDLEELYASLKTKELPWDVLLGVDYRCTYCNTNYMCHNSLISHLYVNHTMELNVKCCKCNKEFTCKYLASNRWKHRCQLEKSGIVVIN